MMCIACSGPVYWLATAPDDSPHGHDLSYWLGQLFSAMSSNESHNLPKEVAGILIPDTEVARDAAAIMRAAAPPTLFNHCLRTYVLGSMNAKAKGHDIDFEMAFVASILHDLGLTAEYSGDPTSTFEENGAAFARGLVEKAGYTPRRAENVAKAILLHAGKAGSEPPDIKFVMVGAGQDVFDFPDVGFSDEQIRGAETAVPRLRFKTGFVEILKEHFERSHNPDWTEGFLKDIPRTFLENRWSE